MGVYKLPKLERKVQRHFCQLPIGGSGQSSSSTISSLSLSLSIPYIKIFQDVLLRVREKGEKKNGREMRRIYIPKAPNQC
jgi:hypothetical protein